MVVAIPIAIYAAVGNAYGSSEFLLKSTADKKYGDFRSCLKNNKNQFTLCIDELKRYISSENKYIRAKKADESKKRLRKVVEYIKQSTDIYIKKAEESNDLIDYKNANIAASLLTKLSPAYETEYAPFLKKSSDRAKGSGVSIILSSYFDKIKSKEPNLKVVETLVNNATPVYDSLDNKLRLSLDKYFDAFIDRYYDYLVEIDRSIESKNFPEVSKLEYRDKAYTNVIEIKQIDSRSEDITGVKQKIADTLSQHFESITGQARNLNDRFVSGDQLGAEEVKGQSDYITYFFDMAPVISTHRHSAFTKVPEFPRDVLDDLKSHRSFYRQSLTSQQLSDSHLHSESLNQRYTSMGDAYEDRLTKETIQRVNLDADSAVRHYQEVVRKDSLRALALLMTLPTKHFNNDSIKQRLDALDDFVLVIFIQIDDHAGVGDHKKAFQMLKEAQRIPGYLERYREQHQEKQLVVLDDYADTLFRKVATIIKDGNYDKAFQMLKEAQRIPGYLERYREQHEKVVSKTRKTVDQYWLGKIVQVAESESFSSAITVVETKMFDSEMKRSATAKLTNLVDKKLEKFSKNMGFDPLIKVLKTLQDSGLVSTDTHRILDKLIGSIYMNWITDEIGKDQLISAAKHIYEPDNKLSVSLKNDLMDDLLDFVEKRSKRNPEAILNVLVAMSEITTIPTETKTSIDNLAQEIVHRWAMEIAKNGILNCKDWKILTIGFGASMDRDYIIGPPIGGPKEKGKYYLWPCEIFAVYTAKSIACKASGESYFLVDGIKQTFPEEIQQSGIYMVMGEYNRNKKNIFNQLVPVLENTYISTCF